MPSAVEIIVCTTCRHPDGEREKNGVSGGALFQERIERAADGSGVSVLGMACLMACDNHCVAHVRAPGKIAYTLGRFHDLDTGAEALLSYAKAYAESDTGQAPFTAWPEGVKGKFLSRTPPWPDHVKASVGPSRGSGPPRLAEKPHHVVGGGLAGSEAAWRLAQAGVPVILHEMRPARKTRAHQTDGLAELVCSNSLRSDDDDHNAVGLLHHELRRGASLIMECADATRIPAGGALAVDREAFSVMVTGRLVGHRLITIERDEVTDLPPEEWGRTIIATGPLTSTALAQAIVKATGENSLAFFDAIAPIVHRDSIDFDTAWFQSRYDKGTGADYINCPMDEAQYDAFVDALLETETTQFRDWERDTPYFEGCLPIEAMAERGRRTLLYGPMKPVGLTNPRDPTAKAHAIVQLRQDNVLGTLYNIVGFQTKMRYGEQTRIFRMIPGLENAEFARLGAIHRNTFLNAPRLLDRRLRLKVLPRLRFAGQITGCEGYVESAAIGLLAGAFAAAEAKGVDLSAPPLTTALGALLNHITGGAEAETYQPMNINFGLFPEIKTIARGRRRERKKLYTNRAKEALTGWLGALQACGRSS